MLSKGEETRRTILSTAVSIASEAGLAGLSIGGLASAVGMSKSGLFAHFRSKEQLQLAVLQEAVDRFVDVVISPALRVPRGEGRVRTLVERWLHEWARAEFLPGGCLFVVAAAEFDDRPGPVRDFLAASQRDWIDTLASAARSAVKQGDFHPELDVDQFAFEANSLVLGYHQLGRLLRDPDAEHRLKLAIDALIARSRKPLAT